MDILPHYTLHYGTISQNPLPVGNVFSILFILVTSPNNTRSFHLSPVKFGVVTSTFNLGILEQNLTFIFV
jgi:hypothetical protein